MKIYLQILFCFLLLSCTSNKNTTNTKVNNQEFEIKLDSASWLDSSRNRLIPVTFYSPIVNDKIRNQQLVIVSHGYGENKPGANKSYSYLTNKLASKGYFVVSIQHELPTDDLLPLTGIPQVARRPNWERGAENILFVLNELKKTKTELDFKHVNLIGHSNGGDMTVLFAHKYPNLVDKVISLDNRRMELPRTSHPKIYSLRSSDQPADEGVLPTVADQDKFGIKIIKLPNTIHNDMNDRGNERQKREINTYIMDFLSE
ncbi:alpha/beta hydrolase [Flavobacterium ranwuense]|uniref:Alpha/beta hydrolase n=1 Tax=Flavobacterium ranwuense TaxID=2541725 RepID=A0ABY2DYF5_9FLAO|nr:alpha/beta fold hydrolase [Flavobacterium ranwuense]TDE31621.1 alpha/beta hydrolase [Flavobacterium ranwuense]TDE55595.1 alpha/beta hydrolase [Flavobacterium sp. GT3P67]